MGLQLLYAGIETCFGPSTQGAGTRYQNTSRFQISRHFDCVWWVYVWLCMMGVCMIVYDGCSCSCLIVYDGCSTGRWCALALKRNHTLNGVSTSLNGGKHVFKWGKHVFKWGKHVFKWGKHVFKWGKHVFILLKWGKHVFKWGKHVFILLMHSLTLDSRRVLVGALILYAQYKCPIMNQHPLSLALVHNRALVLGVLIAKGTYRIRISSESRFCAILIYNLVLTGRPWQTRWRHSPHGRRRARLPRTCPPLSPWFFNIFIYIITMMPINETIFYFKNTPEPVLKIPYKQILQNTTKILPKYPILIHNIYWAAYAECSGPANTIWRKLLYFGFETCFGPSTQGAGIRYENTFRIQMLRHFDFI